MYYGVAPLLCAAFIPLWVERGGENPWIVEACDPPFNAESFAECETIEDLHRALIHGNWSLGVAFCIHYGGHAYAFVNQINGGDEWLTIRNRLAFESITARGCWKTPDDLRADLDRWSHATNPQLINYDY